MEFQNPSGDLPPKAQPREANSFWEYWANPKQDGLILPARTLQTPQAQGSLPLLVAGSTALVTIA